MFASLFVLLYAAHLAADYWVIAAPTLSASARVSGAEVTR